MWSYKLLNSLNFFGSGSSKITVETSTRNDISRALQGQEILTPRSTFPRNDERDTTQNVNVWKSPQGQDQVETNFSKSIFGAEDRVSHVRQRAQCMNQIFSSRNLQESYGVGWPLVDQNPVNVGQLRKQVSDQESIYNLSTSPESIVHLSHSSNNNMIESSLKLPVSEANGLHYSNPANSRYRAHSEYDGLHGLEVKWQPGNWLLPLLPPSYPENSNNPVAVNFDHLHVQREDKVKGNGNCKLFGISLISDPSVTEQDMLHTNSMHRPQVASDAASEQHQDMGSDQLLERLICSKSAETVIRGDEQGKPLQVLNQHSLNSQVKVQGGSTRSCIKVFPYLPVSAEFFLRLK